jgi:glycosyltransferase involved in cell wall biosynthesis
MMHVAYLIPSLERMAGAENQLLLLAAGLHRRGWKVSVIVQAGSGGSARAWLREQGIEFISLRMRHSLLDPLGWLRFMLWMRRNRPALLHAHLPHATWMARWSRLFCRQSIVLETLHTAALGPWKRRLAYRLSNRASSCTTAVSPAVAEAFRGNHLIPAEKLRIVPNGIDCQRWRPAPEARSEARARMHLAPSDFLWAASGRLEAVKDFSTLLHAFRLLPSTAHLVLLGAGPLCEQLHREVRESGLSERVTLPGFVEDPAKWLHAADAFVLSSLWEGLPMVLLEAAALALPMVSTRVAGAEEIVLEGETGFLVPVHESTALSQAMLRMMALSAEERNRMGPAARLHVESRFSIATVLDQWEELYQRLKKQGTGNREQGMRE